MKRTNRKKILSGGVIFLVALVVLSSLPGANTEGIASFSIVSENAEANDIPLPNAVCFAKTTTTIQEVSNAGETVIDIDSDHSPFLADNPQFTYNDIADPTSGKTIDQFQHFLKMRCEVGFVTGSGDPTDPHIAETLANQEACEDPNRSDECQIVNPKFVEVRPSSITVQIFAENSQGIKERVYIGNHQTGTTRLTDGNEQTLLPVYIKLDDVLKFMDTGNYQSGFEIKTSGILNMVMEDFSIDGVKLDLVKYYIGENDVPTFFTLDITDNTIGETPGEQEQDPVCEDPQILDEVTNKCITPETQEQGQQEKEEQGENSQDLGPGSEQDPGDKPPKERNFFVQFLIDLWIWFSNLFK